jgi:hypothetical protein
MRGREDVVETEIEVSAVHERELRMADHGAGQGSRLRPAPVSHECGQRVRRRHGVVVHQPVAVVAEPSCETHGLPESAGTARVRSGLQIVYRERTLAGVDDDMVVVTDLLR